MKTVTLAKQYQDIYIYMKIEIVFLAVSAFLIMNIHSEGKLYNKALSYKKYYQMAGVAVAATTLYWLVKKNPSNAKNIMRASNTCIKYLPLDKATSSVIVPMMGFTTSMTESFYNNDSNSKTNADSHQFVDKKIKRSVSESRKKYVASQQDWKCGQCQQILSASFEIDHITRLDRGGTNEVNNLIALCRECHGQKTLLENL